MKTHILFLLSLIFFCLTSNASNMAEQFQLNGAQFKVTVTTTSAKAVLANQNRGYLMVQNSCASTDLITVNLGASESSGTGIQLQPCSTYEFGKVPTNSVWLKSASGSQTAIIIEGNIAQGETT